jgi:hypothetical protein
MPDDGVAGVPVAATPAFVPAPARTPKPTLGIVAFVFAALIAIQPDLLAALVPELTEQDVVGILGVFSVVSLVPFIMGIVAISTRRGRYWGVAATTLALLANYVVFALVSVVHFSLGSGQLLLAVTR